MSTAKSAYAKPALGANEPTLGVNKTTFSADGG
jgi:hypothetical protein